MMNAIIADNYEIDNRGSVNARVNIFTTIGDLLLLVGLIITTTILAHDPIVQHRFILISVGIILIFTSLYFFFKFRDPKIDYIPDPWKKQLANIFDYKELRKEKEFFKFYVIILMVTIATYIYQPYLVAYLIESGGTLEIQHIIFLIIGYVSGMVTALSLTGKWLDNNPRKRITIPMVFSAGIGFIFISFLADVHNPTNIGFFFAMIAFFFVQFGSTGLFICQSTWAQDLLPEKARGKFTGFIGIMWAIAQVPGLWIGAIIADAFGTRWIFIGAGIVLLITGQLFWLAKETYVKK